MKEKTQLMGHDNHKQVASLLQTGSVKSQGENSLTLFEEDWTPLCREDCLSVIRLQSQSKTIVILRQPFL